MTVNGNPVDYHTIHPSLPLENGPAKTDLYTTPQYRWEPSEESSGNASRGVNRLAQGWAPLSVIRKVAATSCGFLGNLVLCFPAASVFKQGYCHP